MKDWFSPIFMFKWTFMLLCGMLCCPGKAQTKIAVVNLLSFEKVTHHHIGETIFSNHDRKYPVSVNADSLVAIAIDSIWTASDKGYEYIYVEVDSQKKATMAMMNGKKKLPYLDLGEGGYDFVLFVELAVHGAYTSKEWSFKDLGFYTWGARKAELYAPIKFYLYNLKKNKGVRVRNGGKEVSSMPWLEVIDIKDRVRKGKIADHTIEGIKNEIVALIVSQVQNFEKYGGMSKGMLRVK